MFIMRDNVTSEVIKVNGSKYYRYVEQMGRCKPAWKLLDPHADADKGLIASLNRRGLLARMFRINFSAIRKNPFVVTW